MTKEEVLQKVNEYCGEKSYTNATLTDGFKEKFSTHFQKLYAGVDVNDEQAMGDMKFALNTAFSSASEIIMEKAKAFESKENEYKAKILELSNQLADGTKKLEEKKEMEIPKELQDQLDELKKFKNEQSKQEKFKNIVKLAKQNIRQDLHKSFENYAKDYQVELAVDDDEQAKKLTLRFQEIFKDSIGDIKPLAPKQSQKQDEEFIESLPKVKVC